MYAAEDSKHIYAMNTVFFTFISKAWLFHQKAKWNTQCLTTTISILNLLQIPAQKLYFTISWNETNLRKKIWSFSLFFSRFLPMLYYINDKSLLSKGISTRQYFQQQRKKKIYIYICIVIRPWVLHIKQFTYVWQSRA